MRRLGAGGLKTDRDGFPFPFEIVASTRRISKVRTATNRVDYGSEDDYTDLADPLLNWEITDEGVDQRRRSQVAYLARYAPGYVIEENHPVHELGAFVAEVSAIVREEGGKSKGE